MVAVEYEEVFNALDAGETGFEIRFLEGGLIHQSLRLTQPHTGKDLFLQRINKNVFPNPELLAANYLSLYVHAKQQSVPFFMAEPLTFRDGNYLFRDSSAYAWRLFSFIPGIVSGSSPATVSEAVAVANAFAGFQQVFSGLDTTTLTPVLPGFHDLGARFAQYRQALSQAYRKRLLQSGELLDMLEKREKYVVLYTTLAETGELPLRIMHHDAKPGNVLFDKKGEVKGVVDFDTTMPGYIFSDFGDMLRSMVAGTGENDECTAKPAVRKAYYESIFNAYLNRTGALLTTTEREYIHFSGIMMTYMQALRFISDHLTGDTYYKVSYTGQNLDRARNQLHLLESLEDFLSVTYNFKV